MKFNIDSVKKIFKNEWKTISIAAGAILLTILIIIFIMFKISSTKYEKTNTNEVNTNIPDFSKGQSNPLIDEITVYIFKSSTCPHCKKALAFFESIAPEYDYLNIVAYEVSKGDNVKLMKLVADALGKEVSGVPFIVIGDKFNLNGYSESRNETLKGAIETQSKNLKYQDIVQKIIKENTNLNIIPEKIGE